MEKKPVVVVDYDLRWPLIFAELREEIITVLGNVALAVEHVGSTSVPGLAAKPIIDLDVVVKRSDLALAIELLATLGYMHRGDLGIKDREAFNIPEGKPTHHLYLCPEDSEELKRHIVFRNYLRSNSHARDSYGALKKKLAARYGNDREGYTNAKTEYILTCLKETEA